MSNTNDIQQLRDELRKIQEQTHKPRRRAVFGFGVLMLVVLFSFVYAFVQQVAATKNAEEANRQKSLAEQVERRALQAEKDAMQARDRAEEIFARLAECQASKK